MESNEVRTFEDLLELFADAILREHGFEEMSDPRWLVFYDPQNPWFEEKKIVADFLSGGNQRDPRAQVLREWLDTLSLEEHDLYLWFYRERLTQEEIAQRLARPGTRGRRHISQQAVAKRLARLRHEAMDFVSRA